MDFTLILFSFSVNQAEINDLKMENRNLRSEDGATGGGRDDGYYRSNDLHSQRLAKDLRGAANNAEHSLRYYIDFFFVNI